MFPTVFYFKMFFELCSTIGPDCLITILKQSGYCEGLQLNYLE